LVVSCVCCHALAEDAINSPHSVWIQPQYWLGFYAEQSVEWGVSGGGQQIGVAGGYAYRFTRNLSIGVGANIHGLSVSEQYGSANAFSVPLLFGFDPSVSSSVRLMMTVGFGYERAWGNHGVYGRNNWQADGLEGLLGLGVAMQVTPKLEMLASGALQVGFVTEKDSSLGIYTAGIPFGLGLRYTL
jgi:hypothetical protein